MEANAALRNIVRRDTGEGYRGMLARLAQESGIETPTAEDLARLDRKRKGKKLSNQDWVSKSDPEAKIAKMKDGTTHLAYKPEHAVDLDTGAVVAAELHPADEGDTTTLEKTLAAAKENLEAVDAAGCTVQYLLKDHARLCAGARSSRGRRRHAPDMAARARERAQASSMSPATICSWRKLIGAGGRGGRIWLYLRAYCGAVLVAQVPRMAKPPRLWSVTGMSMPRASTWGSAKTSSGGVDGARPQHPRQDERVIEAFKKTSPARWRPT